MTYRDAFEACQSSQIPKQLAHLGVVVHKVLNTSTPTYKHRLLKSIILKFIHTIDGRYVLYFKVIRLVIGGRSIGECGRLSQPSWLLVRT